MAKKRDDGDRIRIRFDNEDGEAMGDEPVIDLFADVDEDEDEPRPARTEKKRKGAADRSGARSTVPETDELSEDSDESAFADDADEADKPKRAPSGKSQKERAEEDRRYLDEAEAAEETARLFDRNGRRIQKRKKSRYGHRKNAPQAETKMVRNETIAYREYEAAKERSRQRAVRREAAERMEKERKRRERKARRLSVLKTALIGIGGVAILAVMTWYTTRLRTVNVKPVPDGYTADEIVTVSGLKIGGSILFQRLSDAKTSIEKDAYLRANVQYDFPSTVNIGIERRAAAACVRWGPQNEYLAIIDSTGFVLDTEAETTGGLIVAEGLSITSAQSGRPLGESSDLRISALIRILSKLEELDLLAQSPRLTRIDMSELMSISISTEGNGYTIEVGDAQNLDTKLQLLKKHWAEIMDRAGQYLANGYSTATVYLYSKGGVSISPYEPGYNSAMQPVYNYTLPTDGVQTSPNPVTPEETPDPDATPAQSATPAPTPMPHQNNTFTG